MERLDILLDQPPPDYRPGSEETVRPMDGTHKQFGVRKRDLYLVPPRQR